MRSRLSSVAALLLAAGSAASYTLVDNFDDANFFNGFDFFSQPDPTHGFVSYKASDTAKATELAGHSQGMIYLGTDHTTMNPVGGRASTRVTSKKSYTHGLFIADILHMPVGCGAWPAFWTVGTDWPNNGEIDIIEGVNSGNTNQITLHTSATCSMTKAGAAAGALTSTYVTGDGDCNSPGTGTNGCPQKTTDTSAFGPGFNEGGGGVYAMEWTSQSISVWFFARNSSMANILTGTTAYVPAAPSANMTVLPPATKRWYNRRSGSSIRRRADTTAAYASVSSNLNSISDTSQWPTPQARFIGGAGCDIDQHFIQNQIVFNTAFCGDWAGQQDVWAADSTCGRLAPTCQQYVASNPAAFTDAYWLIRGVKVYQ